MIYDSSLHAGLLVALIEGLTIVRIKGKKRAENHISNNADKLS